MCSTLASESALLCGEIIAASNCVSNKSRNNLKISYNDLVFLDQMVWWSKKIYVADLVLMINEAVRVLH